MDRIPPTLDMSPDGSFRTPPRVGGGAKAPLSFKLLLGAVIVAVLAGAAAVAALALWVVSLLLPVAILAAAVAFGLFKYRQWRRRSTGRGLFPS